MSLLFDDSYFVLGKNFKISDKLTVHNPLVGDVLDFGEDNYYQLLGRFVSKPWDQKVGLFKLGVDFEEVDELEFFLMMISDLSVDESKLLFGDFDFTKLQLYRDESTNDYMLGCMEYSLVLDGDEQNIFTTTDREEVLKYAEEYKESITDCFSTKIIIDKLSYNLLSDFIRKMHYVPISEKPKYGSKHAKEYMLKMEMERLKYSKKNSESNGSPLIYMLSFLANAGNGYTYDNILKMKISTFYDAVMRTMRIKHSTEFMTGFYAGTEAIMRYSGKSLMSDQDPDELNCLGSLVVLSDFEKMRKKRSISGDGENKDDANDKKHSFGIKKHSKS